MVRKSNIVSVGVKGGGGMGEPSYHYNSMSCASSSEKSDMELSDEESPAPSSCSFRASSVAYFWMYSKEKGERNNRQYRIWLFDDILVNNTCGRNKL